MKQTNEQLKKALREQLQQKMLMKEEELRQNEDYMKQWIGMGEEENNKIKREEQVR